MDEGTLKLVAASLYAANQWIQADQTPDLDAILVRAMDTAEVADTHKDDVRWLMQAFVGFGHAIRRAEQKKIPLPRQVSDPRRPL